MNDAPADLRSRYGGPVIGRRTARILFAVAAVVFLAVVAYMGVQYAYQPVTAETTSYDNLDDDLIALTFTVTMEPGTAATCAAQALDEGRAQVGFVEVDVPPSEDRHTNHRVEITTQGDAVSAEVIGCEQA